MGLTWTTWSLGRIKCRYIDFHSNYTREYQLDITLLLLFSDGDKKYIAGEIGKGVQYMHHHNHACDYSSRPGVTEHPCKCLHYT